MQGRSLANASEEATPSPDCALPGEKREGSNVTDGTLPTKNKIMWSSNAPWCATGYGNQTNLFIYRLKDLGYDMACTAFYGLEGRILTMNDVRFYPKGRHPYGLDIIGAHAQQFGANVLITLIDAWVLDPRAFPSAINWIPWFPVDMEPLPPPVRDKVKLAYKRIVFSRFGERMVKDAGLDCYYVPHGVDTKLFYPMPMKDCREALKWPTDKFIVGMVAANKGVPSRKAFCPQIEAFSQLHKKHPDSMLYLHTDNGVGKQECVNLPEFVTSLGLKAGILGQANPAEVDVLFAEGYQYLIGYPDEFMRQAYSSFDVLLSVSMGEGFGIPILEAQACGCPVIVGDWTSMSELCFSGWKIDKSEADPWWTPLAAYQWQPRIGAVLDRLDRAYIGKGREKFRIQATQGALAYDADLVTADYWKPVLFDIFQELNKPDVMPEMQLVKFG